MLFTVHEWRGGNDSRATFIALDHIVAVSDDLDATQYPDPLKTYLLLTTGDRLVTLEPLADLVTRLQLAFLQHHGKHPRELSPENPELPIDRSGKNQSSPTV